MHKCEVTTSRTNARHTTSHTDVRWWWHLASGHKAGMGGEQLPLTQVCTNLIESAHGSATWHLPCSTHGTLPCAGQQMHAM
jgi:hypothetical protein